MTHNMETHSLTWFIVSLSAACIAFGLVMAWFQERDEKKARKRLQEQATSQEIEQKCKAIRMRTKTTTIMKTWEKLSVSQPKHKGRKYDVLISVNGKYIEDTLTWTTLAMWNSEKVAYWRER